MNDGKIIITTIKSHTLALLHKENRILAAQVLRTEAHTVGNIYVGRVQSISENIGAAFVEIGGGCLAFLPLSEAPFARLTNRRGNSRLKPGDELVVQLSREPMKTKQAAVTTKLSLPGQYAVLAVKAEKEAAKHSMDAETDQERGGQVFVSSKLSKEQQAHFQHVDALKEIAGRYRLIVRTNAGSLSDETALIAEAEKLSERLSHILEIAPTRTCYSCLYRAKPDYAVFVENAYRTEYDEVVTDLPAVYEGLQEICQENNIPLRLYEDALLPLYKLYAIEERMGELLSKKVWLRSGGYLVIEPTEALISIDVNTGKYENGKDREETFFRINKEAAEMIALHLRARNLSGMILVDFINMKRKADENALLEHMRALLKKDPVPARALDMTALGLMELTRKKTGPGLAEQMGRKDGTI